MAKLFFRYGAMNSGKSTALLQVAHNYEERGMRVLLVKPMIDTKGNNNIVARLGMERMADILAEHDTDLLTEIKNQNIGNDPISCVLIDEAQFLSREQIDQLFEVVIKENIPVICYGLRSDFQRNLFPGSERLFTLAHSLEELKTICRCGRKAIFVGRKVNGKYVFEGDQVAIDGEDEVTYESLCGKCYLEENLTSHG